jgi:phosphatidylglycerol:prolipoprotein diacylglycerol transferase
MKFGPTGIWIGDFQLVTYYGIILMAGAVAAAFLAEREARRRKLNSEFVWDALIFVLIGGVIGARLWHVFTPTPSNIEAGITTAYYLTHPLDMLNFRMGGLGIPGAVIGGGLALYWFARRKKTSFGLWADIAIPGVALGQAIGRWGNFVNQELYGVRTDLPWGIYIEREQDTFHPLFAYESIFSLLNMFLLLWLGRRFADRLKNGDLVLVYAITYPIARFLLDFLRPDNAQWLGINANQAMMLLVAIASAGFLFWRHRPQAQPAG